MPQYYFDLRDSNGTVVDEEGVELRDVEVAQQEAVRALADMVKESLNSNTGHSVQHMAVEVRDDSGRVLQVKFSVQIERIN